MYLFICVCSLDSVGSSVKLATEFPLHPGSHDMTEELHSYAHTHTHTAVCSLYDVNVSSPLFSLECWSNQWTEVTNAFLALLSTQYWC